DHPPRQIVLWDKRPANVASAPARRSASSSESLEDSKVQQVRSAAPWPSRQMPFQYLVLTGPRRIEAARKNPAQRLSFPQKRPWKLFPAGSTMQPRESS